MVTQHDTQHDTHHDTVTQKVTQTATVTDHDTLWHTGWLWLQICRFTQAPCDLMPATWVVTPEQLLPLGSLGPLGRGARKPLSGPMGGAAPSPACFSVALEDGPQRCVRAAAPRGTGPAPGREAPQGRQPLRPPQRGGRGMSPARGLVARVPLLPPTSHFQGLEGPCGGALWYGGCVT